VVTAKVAEPELPVTVAEDGTDAAAGFELVRDTMSPIDAAIPLRLTVPVTAV
jgi:hypothetical protein